MLYLDLETTGVRFWKNGIHQISGELCIDNTPVWDFDFKVKPYKDAIIDPDALAASNVTIEQIMDYAPMRSVYAEIVHNLGRHIDKFNKLDKAFICGYNNAAFDNNFFRAFFVQNNDEYFGSWFWSSPIDVFVLAAELFKNVRWNMPDFKLSTVAEWLGVEVDPTKLHDGKYDIYLTKECYRLVMEHIKAGTLPKETYTKTMLVKEWIQKKNENTKGQIS